MDTINEVNKIARGLQAHLAEVGYTITDHEAQALSVIGLIAAADCRISTFRLDPAAQRDGVEIVREILDADPKI